MALIAALYADPRGPYAGRPDVDLWDEKRDARLYSGPWPVVAHPPCERWGRYAGGGPSAKVPRKVGDDGGCFEAALRAVWTWGGVLEHPAYSDAFAHFGLPVPKDKGGWQRGICGGWSCHVEQWHYGHRAKKATWLYAFGVTQLPSLRWGTTPDNECTAYVTDGGGDISRRKAALVAGSLKTRSERAAYVSNVGGRERKRAYVSWCGNHIKNGEDRPRLGHKEACATPLPFRDLLISIAQSAARTEAA